MGKGDDALGHLNSLLDRFVQPNTMYAETGPVIETPLSGAQSVHDMLLSSWGDRIRVFPAVPKAWADVTINNLRTEGAFEVSAARSGGVTKWIRVKSLAGEPCRIDAGNLPGTWQAVDARGKVLRHSVADGVITIELRRGQEALVVTKGAKLKAIIAPVAADDYTWDKPRTLRGISKPVDLTQAYNNDGVTRHGAATDGNLGNGYTLPAEELFPAGPGRLGGVNWVFPDLADGKKNNLVPAGQTIAVTRGRYARFNVIGATVPLNPAGTEFEKEGTSPVTVTAAFADGGTQQVVLRISLWHKQTSQRDDVAVQVSHRHSATNPSLPPVNQSARLFHQWVEIDSGRELTALSFEANPAVHIFALSVEAPLPGRRRR